MSAYHKWQDFIEEQISYQQWRAKDDSDPSKARKAKERAGKFQEMLNDWKKETGHRPINNAGSIDQIILGMLANKPDKTMKVPSICAEFMGEHEKPVIMLRLAELVKRGRVWRCGDLVVLPKEGEHDHHSA